MRFGPDLMPERQFVHCALSPFKAILARKSDQLVHLYRCGQVAFQGSREVAPSALSTMYVINMMNRKPKRPGL